MRIVFLLLIATLFISFTALLILCLRRWRGAWFWLASLPVVALTAVILNILIGTLRDRTSHNLWPLEIVVWCAGGLVYLGALVVFRKLIGLRRNS